jgi:hypothetical protein
MHLSIWPLVPIYMYCPVQVAAVSLLRPPTPTPHTYTAKHRWQSSTASGVPMHTHRSAVVG